MSFREVFVLLTSFRHESMVEITDDGMEFLDPTNFKHSDNTSVTPEEIKLISRLSRREREAAITVITHNHPSRPQRSAEA